MSKPLLDRQTISIVSRSDVVPAIGAERTVYSAMDLSSMQALLYEADIYIMTADNDSKRLFATVTNVPEMVVADCAILAKQAQVSQRTEQRKEIPQNGSFYRDG